LLVGILLPTSNADPADPLGELSDLAQTAGATVAAKLIAKRRDINPKSYVGSGKAREIAEKAAESQADTIIFDNDLTPAQIRELEEITERKVIDRSELILDIFAAHARTSESRLQVELAQLEYTYPRLRHMWSHLERVAGGAATASTAIGGIGTRGPGEKQIEIDRRLVQKRVSYLKRKIAEVDRRKIRQIRRRKSAYCVCLVGYTNAGKSTLINLLTGTGTYVADKLFATLGTKTRQWQLDNGPDTLISDTVGFIRDLPHHLIASFRATLEEAINADLLIHVADGSHNRLDDQIRAVDQVLEELGCNLDNRLMVLNKIDRISDPARVTVLRTRYPQAILLSAKTGQGADKLVEEVTKRRGAGAVYITLHADCRNGKLMQYIERHATITSRRYTDSTASITATMDPQRLARLDMFGSDVRIVHDQPAFSDKPDAPTDQ